MARKRTLLSPMMHGRLGTLDDVGYIYPPRAVLNLVIALIDDDAVSEIYDTVKVSLYSKIREARCKRIESRHTSGGMVSSGNAAHSQRPRTLEKLNNYDNDCHIRIEPENNRQQYSVPGHEILAAKKKKTNSLKSVQVKQQMGEARKGLASDAKALPQAVQGLRINGGIEDCSGIPGVLSIAGVGPRGEDSAGWGDDDGGRTERVMERTAGVHFERVLSASSGSMGSVLADRRG
ncbi:hypothetical protein B0H14DRAFT_2645591 [Mycena olivaceomarginata]|nr:hypothetical protein B0H14DRAFT_2645591 [Mycena olivaceomarginata]